MTTQYENLATLELWNDFFKVTPAELPAERQMRARRMSAILGEGTYDAWLTTRQEKAREFMRAYPANWLLANPLEHKKDKKPKGLFD